MYHVVIEKSAAKFIAKLEKPIIRQINKALRDLELDPRPYGYKKLVDGGLLRIKVKQYRIIYSITDDILLVTVVRVAKRDESTY